MVKDKTKEERLKDAEKRKAEAKKREAESLSKLWGGMIEKIERMRKTPEVKSLQERINMHTETAKMIFELLAKTEIKILTTPIKYLLDTFVATYKSIREDFKNVTKMTDEKLNKLFPEREINLENLDKAIISLLSIQEQERHLCIFLDRQLNK